MKLERNDWIFLGVFILFSMPRVLMDLTSDPAEAVIKFMLAIIGAFVWVLILKLVLPLFSSRS